MPRIFLTHSSTDIAFARQFHERLTRDGVDCYIDTEFSGVAEDWLRKLERALKTCEHIVFLLSPEFCNHELLQLQATAHIVSTLQSRQEESIHTLVLEACGHLPTFPSFLRHFEHIHLSTPTTFQANYSRVCR